MRKLKAVSKLMLLGLTGLLIGPLAHTAEVISPNTKRSSCLNVRLRPNGPILGCVKRNETMLGFQQDGNWLKVRYNGREGYVFNRGGRYVRVNTSVPKPTFRNTAPTAQPKPTVQKSPESPGFFVSSPKVDETAPIAEKPAQEPVASRATATASVSRVGNRQKAAPSNNTSANVPVPTRRPAPPTLDGMEVQNSGAIPTPRSANRPTLDGMEIERTGSVPTPNRAARPTLDGMEIESTGSVPTPARAERPTAQISEQDEAPAPVETEVSSTEPMISQAEAAEPNRSEGTGQFVTPYIESGSLNVREKPGTDSKSIGNFRPGKKLEVTGRDGEWIKVKSEEGTEGWVHGDFATEVKSPGLPEEWELDPEKTVNCGRTDNNPVKCLYCNMVFETYEEERNGGGPDGRRAIAYVIFNRMKNHAVSSKFHADICKNVWEPAQFSWTTDGKSDVIKPGITRNRSHLRRIHKEAKEQVEDFLAGELRPNKARCADHYANRAISSPLSLRTWQREYPQTGTYGSYSNDIAHTFYKKPGTLCFEDPLGNQDAWNMLAKRAGMIRDDQIRAEHRFNSQYPAQTRSISSEVIK